MTVTQVVLANDSRLLREMLRHAINKNPRLQIADVVFDISTLPTVVDQIEPRWVIVSLSSEGHIPAVTDEVLQRDADIRILGMNIDGSQAKVKYITSQEKDLGTLSLPQLIAILVSERLEGILPTQEAKD